MQPPPKPETLPANPCFSSGPCAKRPGWSVSALACAFLGRSHRSRPGAERLTRLIDESAELLGLPGDYLLGIVPASDTGAMEAALWSLLGLRGVDVLAWESFGLGWATDVTKQLGLDDARVIEAGYGKLPELARVDFSRDVVFTWNGTTSGVRVPDGDWIEGGREGLTICDATSAAFAMELPWEKLDAATYSWQKVLGGEAQHGMLILGPRAVERLESYAPPWPLPKLFRLTTGGKLMAGIFRGATINTPSMLAVEDALDGLVWARSIGGLSGLVARTQANFRTIEDWVGRTPWVDFLAEVPETRSPTSVCLKISDPWFQALDTEARAAAAKDLAGLLAGEGAAFDIESYRDAPPGLRLWAGATVETADLEALFPWLDWAFGKIYGKKA